MRTFRLKDSKSLEKIIAIKELCSITPPPLGLKEAKDAIDRIRALEMKEASNVQN